MCVTYPQMVVPHVAHYIKANHWGQGAAQACGAYLHTNYIWGLTTSPLQYPMVTV